MIIHNTIFNFDVAFSRDDFLCSSEISKLFSFLQGRDMDRYKLRKLLFLVIREYYNNWIKDPFHKITFTGTIANFFAICFLLL